MYHQVLSKLLLVSSVGFLKFPTTNPAPQTSREAMLAACKLQNTHSRDAGLYGTPSHFLLVCTWLKFWSPALDRIVGLWFLRVLEVIPFHPCFTSPCLTHSCLRTSPRHFLHLQLARLPLLRCFILRGVHPLPLCKERHALAEWLNNPLSQEHMLKRHVFAGISPSHFHQLPRGADRKCADITRQAVEHERKRQR